VPKDQKQLHSLVFHMSCLGRIISLRLAYIQLIKYSEELVNCGFLVKKCKRRSIFKTVVLRHNHAVLDLELVQSHKHRSFQNWISARLTSGKHKGLKNPCNTPGRRESRTTFRNNILLNSSARMLQWHCAREGATRTHTSVNCQKNFYWEICDQRTLFDGLSSSTLNLECT
jgi:hypothetical protein